MPMISFKPKCLPVLIGSLPISDHVEATRIVFQHTPEIPLWVQLPTHREEGMMVQFLPGIPGITYEGDRVFIDTSRPSFSDESLKFYEEYLAAAGGHTPLDRTRFSLTPETAKGFFVLSDLISTTSSFPEALKGQITGPITLATTLTDQNRRAIFYDDQVRDLVLKILALKAKWQVEKLATHGVPAIVFIDEPALAGFGTSAFMTISHDEVKQALSEVITAIHQAGGLAGVHVCANTDWSLILDSDADILSFDAYGYFDRLILYQDALKNFIQRGSILAWGIVPTSDNSIIDTAITSAIFEKWNGLVSQLERLGIDRAAIIEQSLITPSCGTGSLTLPRALKVLKMTQEVSQRIRD